MILFYQGYLLLFGGNTCTTVLAKDANKHLMTGPEGNSEFCFPDTLNGRVFTSGFSGRLASDNRKFRKNSSFLNSLKVKRVGKFQ